MERVKQKEPQQLLDTESLKDLTPEQLVEMVSMRDTRSRQELEHLLLEKFMLRLGHRFGLTYGQREKTQSQLD
jgi:hypothetical protein